MATLVWDKVDERTYQIGIDHGVLYLNDGTVVPWNGLTGVEESSDSEVKVFYLDGVKYLINYAPGDFSAKLKAYTYPDEFELVSGVGKPSSGFTFYDQPIKSFNLSYRTKVGETGYKIHILYNIFADPETVTFATMQNSSAQPVEFTWTLTGIPSKATGYRPTIHVSIDSTKTPPELMTLIETILYGTETTEPSLPTIEDLAEFFGYLGALIVIDHGDGRWSAVDESDTYISMLDNRTFQIDNANVVILDPDTYQISSTNTTGSS